MSKDTLNQKQFFSEWLEKLQQESWQLELLISGFALFGVWESHDSLVHLKSYVGAHTNGPVETIIQLVMSAVLVGWVIFFTNLLVHIIFRGLWIGAIGLRYISGEIEYDKLNYSEIFTNHLKKKVGDFDNYIESLEKISSVLFSYTFLLFFIFLSFFVLIAEFFVFILIMEFFVDIDKDQMLSMLVLGLLGIIFIIFILFIIIDFITIGGLRKIKEPNLAKVYLFFYKIFSVLTLSFLYRPLIYNFLDQKYTKRLYLMGIPYGLLISLIFPNFLTNSSSLFPTMGNLNDNQSINLSRYYVNPNYYDDLRENQVKNTKKRNQIYYLSLENHDIETDYTRIFLRFRDNDEHLFDSLNYKVAPYSHIGLKHRYFKSGYLRNDPYKDSIKLENSKERLVMKKTIHGFKISQDEYDSSYVNTYQGYTKDSIFALSTKINDKYKPALDQRSQQRHIDIIDAMKSIHDIQVDSINIQLEKCMFFEHPNLGERGVVCYMNLSQVPSGPHEFLVNRKVYTKRKNKTHSTKQFYIPFFKN